MEGVSLRSLFAMSHEELNDLAIKLNMPGDDLSQLQIQIFCQKSGPLSPISPIPVQTPEKWTPTVVQPAVSSTGHNSIAGHNSRNSNTSGRYSTASGHNSTTSGRNSSTGHKSRNSNTSGHMSSSPGHMSNSPGHNSNSPVTPIYATPQRAHQLRSHQLGAQMQKLRKLELVFKTYKEVKLTSYGHSTDKGMSCMLDNKSSGSRAKVFRCRSMLSKKFQDMGPLPPCNYCLHWTLKKPGWSLNVDKSTLEHAPLCCSGQTVNQFQLTQDPEFVKHCTIEKYASGKAAADNALGGKRGRLDGSVQPYTARRARLSIQHFNDKDYNDDWHKMAAWGAEWERINPQSRFVVEKDEENG